MYVLLLNKTICLENTLSETATLACSSEFWNLLPEGCGSLT